jgi:glycosyltransferase involved in cell wall biosynthesis
MAMTGRPSVSVLTPVYNGEQYLAECIESVLSQTYSDWEYVIVDNASTDRTAEIIARYAAREPRIRVYRNERLVPVVANHNIAVRHVSPDAAWCKFVSADDVLFPECLEKMVALGLDHPGVGLIAAYQVKGPDVTVVGLPYPSPVTPGRTVGRASLLGVLSVFGNSTAHMLRADLVRRRDPLYDETILHADEAACYDVLQESDFGFVHQVLTYQRRHRGTITHSVARRLNTYVLAHMKMLKAYGPVYLAPDEYERVVRERMATYYRYLARALLTPARREIWKYHGEALAALDFPVRRRRLARAMLAEGARAALSPGTNLKKLVRLLRARGNEEVEGSAGEIAWREWWAPTGFEPIKGLPP